MKKHFNLYSILALACLLVVPFAITKAQTIIDTTAAGSIGASLDASQGSGINQASILQKIRKDVQNREQNLQTNQEIRRNTIENSGKMASTSRIIPRVISSTSTRPIPAVRDARFNDSEERHGIATSSREDGRNASSTFELRENRKDMRRDMFNIERQKMASQLEMSINNLKQVRNRIDSRIQKEQQNGRNMSSAIALLKTADAKIVMATNALQAFKELKPVSLSITATTTGSTGTTTQMINLDSAKKNIENVRKTIKDAQKSLNDVVVAIAHSMGFKFGQRDNGSPTASTTPTITPSSTPTVSTTATTTQL